MEHIKYEFLNNEVFFKLILGKIDRWKHFCNGRLYCYGYEVVYGNGCLIGLNLHLKDIIHGTQRSI